MNTLTPIFRATDAKLCSVPVPNIDAHKADSSVVFTPEQIAAYKQSQTHPSIVYVPNGWNGHKYWLATTPYPSGVGVFENPCIYYGDEDSNGNPPTIFNSIAGNPIVKVPNNNTINSDPDLYLDGDTMWMISRENFNGYATFAQKSTNGMNWTERGATPLWKKGVGDLANIPELLSPAITKDSQGYAIYTLSGTTGAYGYNNNNNLGTCWGVHLMRGTTFENGGDFSYQGKIPLVGFTFVEAWHQDIFEYGGKMYMILCGINQTFGTKALKVYLAEMIDGKFYIYARPIISDFGNYRPTAFVRESDGKFVLYFSSVGWYLDTRLIPTSDYSRDGRYIGLMTCDFESMMARLRADVIEIGK